jgi:hypothetical protein
LRFDVKEKWKSLARKKGIQHEQIKWRTNDFLDGNNLCRRIFGASRIWWQTIKRAFSLWRTADQHSRSKWAAGCERRPIGHQHDCRCDGRA